MRLGQNCRLSNFLIGQTQLLALNCGVCILSSYLLKAKGAHPTTGAGRKKKLEMQLSWLLGRLAPCWSRVKKRAPTVHSVCTPLLRLRSAPQFFLFSVGLADKMVKYSREPENPTKSCKASGGRRRAWAKACLGGWGTLFQRVPCGPASPQRFMGAYGGEPMSQRCRLL